MAKRNYFKRVLAGTLAILTVAVYLPANVGTGGLFGSTAITANAETYTSGSYNWANVKAGDILGPGVGVNFYRIYLDGSQIATSGYTLDKYVKVSNVYSGSGTEIYMLSLDVGNATVTMVDNTADIFSVVLNGDSLTADDYEVSYENSDNNPIDKPTEEGTYYAVIKGKGIYSGEKKQSFTIRITALSTASITATASTYTGSTLTPVIKVGDTTLTENTDYTYTVTDSQNNPVDSVVNAGTYHVTVTAVEGSNYTGSKTVDWTVNKADPTASLFTFTPPENLNYDGNAKTATIEPATGITGMGDITVLYTKDGQTGSGTTEPKEVGTYKASVSTSDGDNYNSVTALTADDWTFTIDYAKIPVTLSNLDGAVVVPVGETDALTPENNTYTLQGTKSYNIYTKKSIFNSNITIGDGGTATTKKLFKELSVSTAEDVDYNGTTYAYCYTVKIPDIPQESYMLSHNNDFVGKVFKEDQTKLYVADGTVTQTTANLAATLKGDGTYYYGDTPTAESVEIKDTFKKYVAVAEDENGKAKVYLADASGNRLDLSAGNVAYGTYNLTAELIVDNDGDGDFETGTTEQTTYTVYTPVKYEKRPMSKNKYYLVDGEKETELTVGSDGTITVPANTFTYNGEDQIPEIIVKNGGSNADVVLGTHYTSDVKTEEGEYINAGDYSFKLTAQTGDNNNYTDSVTVKWTIEKATAKVNVTAKDGIIYDGEELDINDFDVTIADENDELSQQFIDEMTGTEVKTSATVKGKTGYNITSAGEQKAVVTLKNPNFADFTANVDATIAKREVKITPDADQSIIYGTEEKPVISVTAEQAVDEDGDGEWDTKTGVVPVDVNVDFKPAVAVKNFDYTYFMNNAKTYEYEISDVELDNYTAVLDDTNTVVFTVKPKELTEDMFTVDFEDADYTFDGTKKLAPEYTFSDGKYKDKYKTAKLKATDFEVGGTDHAILPGKYTLEFSGQGNYTGFVSFDWEIKSIQDYSISASLDDAFVKGEKVYDGKAVAPTSYLYETTDKTKTPVKTIEGVRTKYTYYSVENGKLTKLDDAPKDAGSYRVEVSKTAKGYEFDSYSVDFKINPKEIVITPNKTGKTFGEADPDLADYSYDEKAIIEGETPEITGEYALDGYEGNVGSYAFKIGTIEIASDNYSLKIDGNYVVKPQELYDENIIVFKECTIGDDGWSYPEDCIKVTGIVNGEEIELVRPVYNENTGEYTNTDFKFISATKTKKTGEFSVQIQGIGNYTGFAEAVIEVTQGQHRVTVKNGTFADKSTSAYFADGAIAVATADKPADGYKFGYWKKNGSTISYNPTYTFFVTSDNVELEAVYLEDTDDIEKYGNAIIESVSPDKENKKIQFVSMLNVPEGCKILKAGIVATSDEAKSANLTDANADYVRYGENLTVRNYKYTWTKTNVNETWYVKGYLVYEDANGEEKTVYSDLAKATLDGYEMIEEEKILGTAVMDSVTPDAEAKTLQFVAMLSVPADCTINKAGIVATSNATKAENLTADNADYVRTGTTTKHGYRYTWTKTKVNEKWYVKPYLVYTGANGKEYTVYGELTTGELN